MTRLELIISTDDGEADLRAGDFHNGPAFREELLILVEERTPDETLEISFLPPFSGSFAAPGAADIVADIVSGIESPPTIRLLVASQAARQKLRPRLDRTSVEPRHYRLGALSITVLRGDITDIEADAIVNASNTRLSLGAGVSGAIRSKAQPGLQDALTAIARRAQPKPGDVFVTDSFGLPKTRKILHTPTAAGQAEVIAKALKNCLLRAHDEGMRSLAIPALGAGTGGLGIQRFAELIHRALRDFTERVASPSLSSVSLVLWTNHDFQAVTRHLDACLSPDD